MKKMLFLLAFVVVSLTTWAQRYDFQEGQFYYSINRDRPSEVSVARNDDSYSSFTGELIIPSTVTHGEYTYTVTGINDNVFYNCSEITSVSIPSSMITIGWDVFIGTAFYNDPSNWVDNALYVAPRPPPDPPAPPRHSRNRPARASRPTPPTTLHPSCGQIRLRNCSFPPWCFPRLGRQSHTDRAADSRMFRCSPHSGGLRLYMLPCPKCRFSLCGYRHWRMQTRQTLRRLPVPRWSVVPGGCTILPAIR